ncbi:NAD(P)H-dependent oxidoreductase [Serratia ureilytica]
MRCGSSAITGRLRRLPAEIRRHIRCAGRIRWCAVPFWWFGAPAILKGWMDRVFVYGGWYDSRHRRERRDARQRGRC